MTDAEAEDARTDAAALASAAALNDALADQERERAELALVQAELIAKAAELSAANDLLGGLSVPLDIANGGILDIEALLTTAE